MINNLNIRGKLFGSFGAVIVIMCMIIGGGLYMMGQMAFQIERIVKVNNLRTEKAYEMEASVKEVAIALRSILLLRDADKQREQQDRIKAAWESYAAALKTVEELTARDDTRGLQLLEAIKAGIAEAKPVNNQVMQLIGEGRQAQAAELMINTAGPLTQKLISAIDDFIRYQGERNLNRYETAMAQNRNAKYMSLGMGAFAIAAAFLLAMWLSASISKPLGSVVEAMNRIAQGDLTREVEAGGRDEIGRLAEAVNEMTGRLKNMISEIKSSAASVASAGEELSVSSERMSEGVEQQSQRASQIATSSTEMSQTVIDIAKNAASIATSATETSGAAKDGASIVEKSIEEVKQIAGTVGESAQLITSLGDRSKQIGEIVSVIKDIADQTNLLALNAAIEAARAGEQGRGFAVVADEVRKLAERTGKATSQISEMIGAIQAEVDKAVQSMDEASTRVEEGVTDVMKAGDSLRDIVERVGGLQFMIQQIAASTEEMSSVSETISSDIEAVAGVAGETSASSGQIAASAGDLARLSSSLNQVVGHFRV